ncbi:MAG: VanW family protein, partial [Eggerthellaceae bacterium]|nr:VanW family protein [Eggerthellaceae bacterium]
SIINNDKIYAGVRVGDCDLSGKIVEEAATLIHETYSVRIANNRAIICADEYTLDKIQSGKVNSIESSEDIEVHEIADINEPSMILKYWTISTGSLGYNLNCNRLAEQAYQVGRSDGGLMKRIGSFIFSCFIPPSLEFNDSAFNSLYKGISSNLCHPVRNAGFQIVDNKAMLIDSMDGTKIDQAELKSQLSSAYTASEPRTYCFKVDIQNDFATVHNAEAQEVCDCVNDRFGLGLQINYNELKMFISSSELINMIIPGYSDDKLYPSIDDKLISPFVIYQLSKNNIDVDIEISFKEDNKNTYVNVDKNKNFPNTKKLIEDAENALFYTNVKKEFNTTPVQSTPEIQLVLSELQDSLSFDEALNRGVISLISSHSTDYGTNTLHVNRNTNIEVGTKAVNNTICKKTDPYWSFLNCVGETSADKGYKPAAVIEGGNVNEDYGGGICQVATDVFLAAYSAGFPILERHNHNLYISNYSPGKDAAIAYPDQDLIWMNDTGSDVLVLAKCNGSNINIELYGANPFRTVKDSIMEEKEGEDYYSEYEIDNSLQPSQSYVETQGSKGKFIRVERKVYNSSGDLIRNDYFDSNYIPKTQIIICGSQDTIDKLKKNAEN